MVVCEELRKRGAKIPRWGRAVRNTDNVRRADLRAAKSPILLLVRQATGDLGIVVVSSEQKQAMGGTTDECLAALSPIIHLSIVALFNAVAWLGLIWLFGRALSAMQFARPTSWWIVESNPVTTLTLGGGIWVLTLVLLYTLTSSGSLTNRGSAER